MLLARLLNTMAAPTSDDVPQRMEDDGHEHVYSGYIDHKIDDVVDGSVPSQYRGTQVDRDNMLVLGKRQVLRRNFKLLTMTGFASMVRGGAVEHAD